MEESKKKGLFFVFTLIGTLELALAVTPITDINFNSAISTCLSTNLVDGLCSSSEYGAMPDWDVGLVTDMIEAFMNYEFFNANISNCDTSQVTSMEQMFISASSFNQYIGDWDTSNVISTRKMFYKASSYGMWHPSLIKTFENGTLCK